MPGNASVQLARTTYVCSEFISQYYGLSSAYYFKLKITSQVPLNCLLLLNQPAILQFEGTYRHGMISGIDYLGNHPLGYHYQIILASLIERLKLRFQSRIFQQSSAIEIINQVLLAAGITPKTYQFQLSKKYPKLGLIIQYSETDYAFLVRILHRYGLLFTFQQNQEYATIIFTDTLDKIPGKIAIDYQPETGLVKPYPTLSAIETRLEYCLNSSLFIAKSNAPHLQLGQILTLQQHPDKHYQCAYRILQIKEQWQNNSFGYCNQLQLAPLNFHYSTPCAEPIRRFYGIWIAHIANPETEKKEVFINQNGFYQVNFVFDRSSTTKRGKTKPSLPLLQPTIKMHFPLLQGTEVAVICLEGNVDHPVILGALNNPRYPSPVTKKNPQQAIIRTQTNNEICLDDSQNMPKISLTNKAGKNCLELSTTKQQSQVSLKSLGNIHFYARQNYQISAQQKSKVQLSQNYFSLLQKQHYLWVEHACLFQAGKKINLVAKNDALFAAEHLQITSQQFCHYSQQSITYTGCKLCNISGSTINLASVSEITAPQIKLSTGFSHISCNEKGLLELQAKQLIIQAPYIFIRKL